jgi:beta-galactosidase
VKRSVVRLNRIAASRIGGFQHQVRTKLLITVARSLFLIAAVIVSLLGCDARALPTADAQVRVRQNLDTGWLFARQVHGTGELGSFDRHVIGADKIEPAFQGAPLPAYDDSGWQPIDLPHTWNAYDVTDSQAGYWRGIGWYRKHFRVDSQYAARRIVLEFEGVGQDAEVWLNGTYLGRHKGGYTPFSFEIHPRVGTDNVLTVKVDNLFDSTTPPTVKTDYNFYGGIYRRVSLVITNPIYISQMYWTTPQVTVESAQTAFHSEITNGSRAVMHLTLTEQIIDPKGNQVGTISTPIVLPAGQTKALMQNAAPIANPQLWSPATPNVYHIRTSLHDGSQLIDAVENPLGYRWFRFDPQHGFLLNGKRIQLQGTNLHQTYPGMGNAIPKSRIVRDLEMVHDMGANFWRTSHYPHDEASMDASDRLGLMVLEEIPINKEIGNTDQYIVNVSRMAQEMIGRDRNHPSVITWGIAGEINAPAPISKRVVGSVATLYRQLDPSRPVTMHAPRGEEIADLVDVVGEDVSAATDKDHDDHPQRAYMTAEYSAALIGRGIYGTDLYSEDIGLAAHEKHLSELNQRPWMAGGCIWNQFDYDGETYDPVIPRIVSFGMTDVWRIPKEVYYFYQSQWSAKPMVHIVGHWTWPGEEGSTRTVEVLSNQDEVELFLNGQSLGVKKNIPTAGLLYPPRTWQVRYEPGILKAVARTSSEETTDQQATAGPAYAIALTSDTSQIVSGDPESVAYITASIVDRNGVVIPDAHPAISFTWYGPGELMKQNWLGHGTGLTWNTVDGTTRVAFRSTPHSGRTVISAYSPGLRQGRMTINVTAPGKQDEMNYIDLDRNDELQ